MIKALEQVPVYATLGHTSFEIYIDSEYVYNQVLGLKKTKKNKVLVNEAKSAYNALLAEKRSITIHHVKREKNKAGILLERYIKIYIRIRIRVGKIILICVTLFVKYFV